MPTRDEILNRKIGHGTVDVPGLGTFTIRPLSRNEAMRVHRCDTEQEGENLLVSLGLVEPAMTVDDVEQWAAMDGSAGDLQALSIAIGTISGMMTTSGKESYKSLRE